MALPRHQEIESKLNGVNHFKHSALPIKVLHTALQHSYHCS